MRVLLAIALSLTAPGIASASPDQAAGRDCFLSHDWRGWSAAEEGDALYLRMVNDDIYRVELTPGARVRRYPGEFLVNRVRGSSRICRAIDLVGSSRVDLQACKLEYSIVSPK